MPLTQFVATQFDGIGEDHLKQALQAFGHAAMGMQLQLGPLMAHQAPALALGLAKALQKPWVLSVKDASVKHALKILLAVVVV
jgi:hypothetical protein